ncbi:hypothetical protein NAEX_00079 [Nannocystis exedens]|nr:hypothetical protein NAEX_00079 [Nannocystis exedens]
MSRETYSLRAVTCPPPARKGTGPDRSSGRPSVAGPDAESHVPKDIPQAAGHLSSASHGPDMSRETSLSPGRPVAVCPQRALTRPSGS